MWSTYPTKMIFDRGSLPGELLEQKKTWTFQNNKKSVKAAQTW